MPETSRDFQHAAAQRLATAQFLLDNGYNLDAMYLAGYAVECTLKALILELTPGPLKAHRLLKICRGSHMHNPEILGGILDGELGCPVPPDLFRKLCRSGWSTALRYEYGRQDTGHARGFLRTTEEVYKWVKGQLP